jgi:hypothetical protein
VAAAIRLKPAGIKSGGRDARPTNLFMFFGWSKTHELLLTAYCSLLTTPTYRRNRYMIRVKIMLMRMQVPKGK